jgi:23S rRNA pseudouridine2605 synthase
MAELPKNSPKDSQRIAKLLARAGVASRREIERMIEERRIAIDGVPLETPATIVTSLKGITVDGNPVAAAEPTRLFRYHKPTGLLTAERDMKGRATIYDKLPPGMPRTVPVGRLDLNTEGLLLMTTDGALKRRLELPSTGVPRSYRARAYGPVTQAQLEELIHGIEIDGVRYGQIDANLERRTGTNVWIEMTLKEGKNREVRRVLEHLGLRVSRLIRTRYGPFALEDLPPGEVEEVKQHELVEFLKELGNAEPQPAPEPGIKGTALRKHWRITPSKFVRPSSPSPQRGEGRGEGRAASAAQKTPVPKYRPDPVERPRTPAPARAPVTTTGKPRARPAAPPRETATETPRPPRPRIDKSGWAKAKPKPGRGPKK